MKNFIFALLFFPLIVSVGNAQIKSYGSNPYRYISQPQITPFYYLQYQNFQNFQNPVLNSYRMNTYNYILLQQQLNYQQQLMWQFPFYQQYYYQTQYYPYPW